jgi:ketosteroid isomerase-like protein
MTKLRFIMLSAWMCMLVSMAALAQSAPDKAYAQKIWDGWAAANPDTQTQYYAQGPHVFYDIAPLKYDNWDEYKKGVAAVLGEYSSAKFHVNDDLQVHKATPTLYWGTATIDFEMTHKSGKTDKGAMRWTFVMEKQKDKWLIVHEHVSVPMG